MVGARLVVRVWWMRGGSWRGGEGEALLLVLLVLGRRMWRRTAWPWPLLWFLGELKKMLFPLTVLYKRKDNGPGPFCLSSLGPCELIAHEALFGWDETESTQAFTCIRS